MWRHPLTLLDVYGAARFPGGHQEVGLTAEERRDLEDIADLGGGGGVAATRLTPASWPFTVTSINYRLIDGLVQVSSDGGQNWTRAAALPGLPPLSFVNDVEASLHDPRTIFAVADAHNEPGRFTAFIGWEWSAAPDNANRYRRSGSTLYVFGLPETVAGN